VKNEKWKKERSAAREGRRTPVGKLNKSSFCPLLDCLQGPVT